MASPDQFPDLKLSQLPCCPVCLEDGPSEWVQSQKGCCCRHTPPRPIPEEWTLPEGWEDPSLETDER
jgi:hypothetical protein